MSKVAQTDFEELKSKLQDKGIEVSDQEIKDSLEESKSDTGDAQKNDLNKLVKELSEKVNKLDHDIKEIKDTKYRDNLDADLNDSIMQTAMRKRASFIKIMDQLDDLAEYFSSSHPDITRRIDDISDQIRFYNRQG